MKFEKTIEVKWSDTDPNGHVRHSAYYDYGGHLRIRFFADSGFDTKTLTKLNTGPILFEEKCSFLKEILPNDTLRVNLLKGEINEDASKWDLHHEVFNQHNEKCAHISVKGAWLDLEKRKLTKPPKELAAALHNLELGEEYVYKKLK